MTGYLQPEKADSLWTKKVNIISLLKMEGNTYPKSGIKQAMFF
jgi:hypothetical protein